MNFGSGVIDSKGIKDLRGLYSDGETMFVLDDEDQTVYALKMSDQTRDGDRDIALDPDNADAEGLWYDGGVLWVVDDEDDKLYAYRLSYTADTGLTVYNLLPTGMPTITGTLHVGGTLTAGTADIDDANGIPEGGTYAYQWTSSHGATYEDIARAQGAIFRPLQSDLGKTLKVTVTFTDGAGFDEGPLTSDATGAVVASPYGNVIYSATLTVGVRTFASGTQHGYNRLVLSHV